MSARLCACGKQLQPRWRKCESCVKPREVSGEPREPQCRAELRVWDESRDHLVAAEARWVETECGERLWTTLLPGWAVDRGHPYDCPTREGGQLTCRVVRVSDDQSEPDPTTPSLEKLLQLAEREGYENLWLPVPGSDWSARPGGDPRTGYDTQEVALKSGKVITVLRTDSPGSVTDRTRRETFEPQR